MSKTLILTLEYPPQVGGIASYVFNVVSHLPANQVMVYAPPGAGSREFDAAHPWKVARKNPYFSFFWPRWIKAVWQIYWLCRQEKITRIHVHHILPMAYVAFIINKLLKIPFTIFLHGTDLEMGTAGKAKREKFAWMCAKANAIVVNSDFLKDKLSEKIEGIDDKIKILYPCPGDHFFSRASEETLADLRSQLALRGKKVILTVARMTEGKGYPHLARLLPKVLEKIPNLVWLVIGDGPKKEVLIQLIQKYYLQNVTRFLGSVPYEELPRYYQLADLFVVLTHPDESTEEGWGTAFMEAAASGVPVVAGRVGGVEESVQNLSTGLIVDVYQDESVVAAICDLIRESDYAKQMGERGRERAMKEFRWEKQITSILNIGY